MGVPPKRLRQSPMLTPHTDSLSCGLLASGNAAAHRFEVKAGMKGSEKDREKGTLDEECVLDMIGALHENEQGGQVFFNICTDNSHILVQSSFSKCCQINKLKKQKQKEKQVICSSSRNPFLFCFILHG